MAVERYQRLKRLGQGMMSVVWLARDALSCDFVALKVMHTITEDDQRNQKAIERFQREIKIARTLDHPHVLPIIDYGYTVHDGHRVPFFVSPYIEEGSLAELVRTDAPWREWSLVQIADAIMQAADSLWYLHTRNPQIVHQDVKPGNFLFHSVYTPQRAVYLYLCDFGISRWLQSDSALASELLGTFAYIAPEQVERQVNCSSDQYALAVMACYLLTGKLPLQAPTNELYAKAHLEEVPLLPSQLNAQRFRSPEVDAVIKRALAKQPEQRYPTVVAFGEALQQAIACYVREHPEAPLERVVKENLSVVAGVSSGSSSTPALLDIASIALDPPSTGSRGLLDEPLPFRPVKAVPVVRDAALPLESLPLQLLAQVILPARPKMLSWSRDGYALACACYGHAPLYLCKDGSTHVPHIPPTLQINSVAWSPDRRVLALNAQGEIYFWDTAKQVLLPLIIALNVRNVEAMDWSMDGRLALWVENRVLVYLLSYAALTVTQPPLPLTLATGTQRSGAPGVMQWSPVAPLLAAGGNNGTVLCWDVRNVGKAWQVATLGQKVNSLAWSPEGEQLLVASRDNRVLGWAVRDWQQMLAWERLPMMPRMVSASMTGRVVIASSEKRLLCGYMEDTGPSSSIMGQLLAVWSPAAAELATLDAQQETTLMIWHD